MGHTISDKTLMHPSSDGEFPVLRMVFWELTNACNLHCVHCRALPAGSRSPHELTTEEAKLLLEQIVQFARPSVVLSGGEPLIRPDWAEIANYGTSLGLQMLIATNGSLLTREVAEQMTGVGIKRISVSIDGADAKTHDSLRGVPGAFEAAWEGISKARSAGIEYQINTTVTKSNVDQIPAILNLATERGAAALHIFLLVPTGCGLEIADEEMISPDEYEHLLGWLYDQSGRASIGLRATCAPHYVRIAHQRSWAKTATNPETNHPTKLIRGCLAGSAVCFVSHSGEVFPCGYLPVSAGNVRIKSMEYIWRDADVFRILRDSKNLQGKCGYCEYRQICMGCRARAFALTGNYLAEEPYCLYEPRRKNQPEDH
ncbi:MAG: radical SAM protein [Armatimonadota bacterium]